MKLANLRLLLAYQFTRPGKKLLFMGTELATPREWNHDASLDWHLLEDPMRAGFDRFMEALGAVYRAHPAFWKHDHDWTGFRWIDVGDRQNSVVSYVRNDGERHVVVVLNLTPVPREHYRIGVPGAGPYRVALSSDDERFGGSGIGAAEQVAADAAPFHGHAHSVELTLPPLGALVLVPERGTAEGADVADEASALDGERVPSLAVENVLVPAAHTPQPRRRRRPT